MQMCLPCLAVPRPFAICLAHPVAICLAHQEAEAALAIYESVADAAGRKSFISQFESCGNGKGKDSLKFVHTFSKTLSQEDKSAVASVDNFFTRPRILEILGLHMQDFKTVDQALQVYMCSRICICTLHICICICILCTSASAPCVLARALHLCICTLHIALHLHRASFCNLPRSPFCNLQEAFLHPEVADEEIEANKKCFEHDGACVPHTNPLLSKFRYIESKGLKREWEQVERKELHGTTGLRKLSQLQEAKEMLECMGPGRILQCIRNAARPCLAWHCLAWPGLAWPALALPCIACRPI